MNSRVILTGLTFAAFCACLVHQAEAGWRDRLDVKGLIKHNPGVKKLLDGPLGAIFDIVAEVLIALLDFILGGMYVPMHRFKNLENEFLGMKAVNHGGMNGF